MSFDNQNQPPIGASVNTMPPKKSGGLKWILGGCGCLGLLMAACIVGFVWFSYSTFTGVQQEAKSFIEGSSVVQEQLGTPVTITGESFDQAGQGKWVFEFDLTGPKGSGVATVNMENDGQSMDFQLGQSSLEVNGQTIDLNAENEFAMPPIEGFDE